MVMNRTMYFGTKERMTYIHAPAIDYDAPKVGWNAGTQQLLNGGAYTRRSVTGHMEYNFTWNNLSRAKIREINDYADGVYGTDAIYFLDPFAMDTNLLPQYWATPRLSYTDGIVLSGQSRDYVTMYPIALTNTNSYPQVAAQYVYDSASWPVAASRPSLYIPIPPDYTLWFGAHGVVSAAGSNPLTVLPTSGTLTNIAIQDVADTARFSQSWSGATYSGVTISLGGTGTAVLSGMIAQVLPTGVLPATGGYISGQGNSGVRFDSSPVLHPYSAAMDMETLSAKLVEDQAWR